MASQTSLNDSLNDILIQATLAVVEELAPLADDPPTDGPDSLTAFSVANYSEIYTDYRIDVSILTDDHTIQLPIASRGSKARSRIIRTAAPTSKKIVQWTAERIEDDPLVPHPISLDPNEVLHKWRLDPVTPIPAADGVNMIYRISGEYTYLLQDAVEPGQAVTVGAQPNLRTSADERFIPASAFSQAIMNPQLANNQVPKGPNSNQ